MLHFARTMSDCLISSKRVFAKLEPVSSVQYLAVKIQWCEAKHKCEWQSAWAEIKFLFTSDLGNGGKDLSINIRVRCFFFFCHSAILNTMKKLPGKTNRSSTQKRQGRLESLPKFGFRRHEGSLSVASSSVGRTPIWQDALAQLWLYVTSNFALHFIALSKLQIVQLFCHLL